MKRKIASKVISLPGIAGCNAPGVAEKAVVEALQGLLAEAKRGEITGLIYGIVRPNRGGISTGWEPGSAGGVDMLAAASGLQTRIAAVWLSNV